MKGRGENQDGPRGDTRGATGAKQIRENGKGDRPHEAKSSPTG